MFQPPPPYFQFPGFVHVHRIVEHPDHAARIAACGRLHDGIGNVDTVHVVEDEHLRIAGRCIGVGSNPPLVLGGIGGIAFVDEFQPQLAEDHLRPRRSRSTVSRNHRRILPRIDLGLGRIRMDVVKPHGVAEIPDGITYPVCFEGRPYRRVGSDQLHPAGHAVPPQGSIHGACGAEPEGIVAPGRSPRAVRFVDDIVVTDAIVTALFDQVAHHLSAAVDQRLVDGLRLPIDQASAPVAEQYRHAMRIAEPENHVQILHVPRRVEPPVREIRPDTAHHADETGLHVLQPVGKAFSVGRRKPAVDVMHLVRIPLDAIADIGVVDHPAAQCQHAPSRRRPLRRGSVAPRTGPCGSSRTNNCK